MMVLSRCQPLNVFRKETYAQTNRQNTGPNHMKLLFFKRSSAEYLQFHVIRPKYKATQRVYTERKFVLNKNKIKFCPSTMGLTSHGWDANRLSEGGGGVGWTPPFSRSTRSAAQGLVWLLKLWLHFLQRVANIAQEKPEAGSAPCTGPFYFLLRVCDKECLMSWLPILKYNWAGEGARKEK